MRTKIVVNWTLVFMVVVALSTVLAIRNAGADCGGGNGSDDPPSHGCERDDHDDHDGGGGNADQSQDQDQDQSQYQDQDQDQSQTSSQANDQEINFNAPKQTGRSYMSSGDATADCQKFGGISSGWVGGALGLGINFTDKECRQLQIYDRLVDRGLLTVANKALCDTKTLRKLYGKGGAGTCQAELKDAYQDDQDARQDDIDDLRRMVRELSQASRAANTASQGAKTGEMADTVHNGPPQDPQDGRSTSTEYPGTGEICEPCPDCSEHATRAFQACVSK